jgi:hypothetical protein
MPPHEKLKNMNDLQVILEDGETAEKFNRCGQYSRHLLAQSHKQKIVVLHRSIILTGQRKLTVIDSATTSKSLSLPSSSTPTPWPPPPMHRRTRAIASSKGSPSFSLGIRSMTLRTANIPKTQSERLQCKINLANNRTVHYAHFQEKMTHRIITLKSTSDLFLLHYIIM